MNLLAEMAAYPHRVTESVRFSETDQMGHVNNTVFGIYFEVGRTAYLCDNGFYRQSALGLVIVKTEINFRSMIHWPGSVEIGTRVAGAGRSSFVMEQVLRQDDRLAGSAVSIMVVIDLATNRSTAIPDEIRACLKLPC